MEARMSPEKEMALSEVNPLFFRSLPYIECGDGWFELLRDLGQDLLGKPVEAGQIKEKFGSLRIYAAMTDGSCVSKEIEDRIHLAEIRAERVCEDCGKPATFRHIGQLYFTVCTECYEAHIRRRGV